MSNSGIRVQKKAAPGCVFLFGLFFAAMACLFFFFIVRDLFKTVQAHHWPQVPAIIQHGSIERTTGDKARPYEIQVQFTYVVDGTGFHSSTVSTQPKRFGDYSKAQRLLDKLNGNRALMAWYNPEQPGEAILVQPSYTIGLALLFPILFFTIGCGVMWLVIQGKVGTRKPPRPSKAADRPWVGWVFFGAFFLLGLLLFLFMTARPLWQIHQAKSWTEVPCRVESSHILTHHGDKSDTYSVDILYAYEFNGKHYKSNRYHFMGGSSSGYKGKQKIIEQFSAGKETVCYVNPADPYTAVLNRGFTSDLWFGLIPLLFTFIGAGGVYHAAKKRAKQKNQTIYI